jgi:hypothetical protein
MADEAAQDSMVPALLAERAELEHRGLNDRVRQVDEQLALRGHKAAGQARAAAGATKDGQPQGRGKAQPQTAA